MTKKDKLSFFLFTYVLRICSLLLLIFLWTFRFRRIEFSVKKIISLFSVMARLRAPVIFAIKLNTIFFQKVLTNFDSVFFLQLKWRTRRKHRVNPLYRKKETKVREIDDITPESRRKFDSFERKIHLVKHFHLNITSSFFIYPQRDFSKLLKHPLCWEIASMCLL